MSEEMTIQETGDDGQLRRRAFRALSEESIRKARICTLRAELNTLESNLATTTPRTTSTLISLAQSECLSLTTQIMTKLPRELRDMIYVHLSTRERELIEREHFRTTLDPLTRVYSYNFDRWKAQHFPELFWDTSYVPKQFYEELVENYYRTSTFLFTDDAGVMSRFLTTSELHPSMLPSSLVSSTEISLNAVSHDRGSFRAYMFGVPKTPERLKEALKGILELKAGAKVVVRFVTEAKSKEERDEHCKAAMGVLFDGEQVERMREKGLKVRFVVDEGHVHNLAEMMREDWAGMHGVGGT